MSEPEMTTEVETEEFTDEQSDEALDREPKGGVPSIQCYTVVYCCRAGN